MKHFISANKYLILLILVLSSAAMYLEAEKSQKGLLAVHFLSVGQGDAVLVETPTGKRLLMDGGPKRNIEMELQKLLPFWDRAIDVITLSHPQSDHLSGLVGLAAEWDVGHAIITGARYANDEYARFLGSLEARGITATLARPGVTLRFGDGVTVETLYPDSPGALKRAADVNESSAVFRLDFGNISFLFTGDAGFDTEGKLMKKYASKLDVDGLKVGHHGSNYASGQEFLRRISPAAAVIQVGENSYGHPAPEAIERLKKSGAYTYRTDKDGTVTFVTDGKTVWRETAKCFLFCRRERSELFTKNPDLP